VSAESLAQVFEECGCQKVYCLEDVAAAFDQALLLRGKGLLFCVGSLYLVGEIKALLRRRIDD
jgi:dihydrofolate synthase/folylpolyglutamate synthase